MANEPLRMLTAFHSPFYAPVYTARRLGLFAEEGLGVTIAAPERMLVEGGLVRAVPFEAVADNTFAEAAITALA